MTRIVVESANVMARLGVRVVRQRMKGNATPRQHRIETTMIASLPKSGTNLVAAIFSVLHPGSFSGVHIGSDLGMHADFRCEGARVPVGIDFVTCIPAVAMRAALLVSRGRFLTAHVPPSERLQRLLMESGTSAVVVVRDPRSVVLSQVDYVRRLPQHPLHERWRSRSMEKCLIESSVGCTTHEGIVLRPLNRRIDDVLSLAAATDAPVIRFEDLALVHQGDEGTASRLAASFQCDSATELIWATRQAWGHSKTFNVGKVGRFEQLPEETRETLHEVLADCIDNLGYF